MPYLTPEGSPVQSRKCPMRLTVAGGEMSYMYGTAEAARVLPLPGRSCRTPRLMPASTSPSACVATETRYPLPSESGAIAVTTTPSDSPNMLSSNA
eukprot:scaffold65182_cov36-Prasinocladus_malaysianus.AAC.1